MKTAIRLRNAQQSRGKIQFGSNDKDGALGWRNGSGEVARRQGKEEPSDPKKKNRKRIMWWKGEVGPALGPNERNVTGDGGLCSLKDRDSIQALATLGEGSKGELLNTGGGRHSKGR